jgi:hypothetical protein
VRHVLNAFFSMCFGMLLGIAIGLLFVVYVLILYLLSGEAPFAAYRTTFLSTVVLYLGGGIVAGGIAGLLGPLGRGPIWAAFVGFAAALPVAWALTRFFIADMTHQTPTALLSALALGVPVGLIYRGLFGDWFSAANGDGAST